MNNNIENNNGGVSEIVSVGEFFAGIYRWMAVGVFVSGIFAYIVVQTNYFDFIFQNQLYFYGIIGLEIALMLGVQFLIKKLPPKTSLGLFLFYAALNGITLSGIFSIYQIDSILAVFAGAIAMFIALAYFGYTTKKDLSGWKTFLMIGVWGVFISSIVNVFILQSSVFDIVISAIALVVFAALTIYDNQYYKTVYNNVAGNVEEEKRYTVLGALHMYINFIVIFVELLKFLGNEK